MTSTEATRDEHGRFKPGHPVGQTTRFKTGQRTPNPKGRPRGVNGWTRDLRSRRYHPHELEDVVADDFAERNKREAAVRLLCQRYLVERRPKGDNREKLEFYREQLARTSNADLRWIACDPREDCNRRAVAWSTLLERGAAKRPQRRWRRGKIYSQNPSFFTANRLSRL
jgi:hypothetical protein